MISIEESHRASIVSPHPEKHKDLTFDDEAGGSQDMLNTIDRDFLKGDNEKNLYLKWETLEHLLGDAECIVG